MGLTIRTRAWWGATAPTGPGMVLPVGELWLHHSVTPLTSDAAADMRQIERVGVQRFGRFSYSWAYHRPTRTLLEGAGDTVGAHTAGRNSTSLGLVLVGNYDTADLDDVAVADLGDAIRWLIDTKRLRPGTYPTGGHRDLKSTACPGGRAYSRLGDIRAAAGEEDVTPDELKKALRDVLNEGTGAGQPDWKGTSKSTLAVVQGNTNLLRQIVGLVGKIDGADEAEIAAQVLAGIGDTALSDEQVASIIDAIPGQVKQALREGVG